MSVNWSPSLARRKCLRQARSKWNFSPSFAGTYCLWLEVSFHRKKLVRAKRCSGEFHLHCWGQEYFLYFHFSYKLSNFLGSIHNRANMVFWTSKWRGKWFLGIVKLVDVRFVLVVFVFVFLLLWGFLGFQFMQWFAWSAGMWDYCGFMAMFFVKNGTCSVLISKYTKETLSDYENRINPWPAVKNYLCPTKRFIWK